jgi:hypothetical protein
MRLSTSGRTGWGRCVAVLVFAGLLTASPAQSIDVLFVGNSYINGYVEPVLSFNRNQITDLNNQGNNRQGGVPGIFKALAAAGGYEVNVSMEALSGQTLETHLATKSGVIGQAKWDWVVLQEYSSRPLPQPVAAEPLSGNIAAFRAAVEGLSLLVKHHNPEAGILLQENWARPNLVVSANNPSAPYLTLASQQADIHAAMGAAAADFSLDGLAPVGAAFFAAIDAGIADNTRTPGLEGPVNLWFGDAYHASAYGSYLSALVYYVEILGGDPRDLATGPGSVAAQLGLNAGHALALASIAYETATPPVPEPSSLPCLAGALLALAAFRNRQRPSSRT